jgi:hypothetical protein
MSKPIIDLATLEEVKPAEETKKEESPDAKKEEENEEKDDDPDGDPNEEGGDEDDKHDGEEGDPDGKEEGDEDDADKPVDINDFIAQNYKEKYGIESEEDLVEVLDRLDTVMGENETLKADLETAKQQKPVYKTEKQKKIAEMLERIDPSHLDEGFQTVASIMAMDLEKADKKAVLQENYILQHQELTREQARRKFEKDFNRKYVVDKAKFEDDPEALKEAEEDVDTDMAIDYAKAKKNLLKEQENLKTTPAAKADEPKENEELTKGIERYHGEFETVYNRFEKSKSHLTFKVDGAQSNDFPVIFNKEQLAQIKTVVDGWVKNPSVYNEKGQVKDKLGISERIKQAAFALYGDEMIAQIIEHATQVADIKKVDEVAKKKPDRKGSPAGGGDIKNMSADAQFEFLAKKKKAQRDGRQAA